MNKAKISIKLAGPELDNGYVVDTLRGAVTITTHDPEYPGAKKVIRRGDWVSEITALLLAISYDVTVVAPKG